MPKLFAFFYSHIWYKIKRDGISLSRHPYGRRRSFPVPASVTQSSPFHWIFLCAGTWSCNWTVKQIGVKLNWLSFPGLAVTQSSLLWSLLNAFTGTKKDRAQVWKRAAYSRSRTVFLSPTTVLSWSNHETMILLYWNSAYKLTYWRAWLSNSQAFSCSQTIQAGSDKCVHDPCFTKS